MLETIQMRGTHRITTRLGFGGSGLMGGLSERESLRLLETAFDVGIRHFDVAPSYGHGLAEGCLGKFLRGKADQLTITTKYGIFTPPQANILGAARSILRPVVRRLPAVRKRVAQAAAALKTKARFSAEEAQRSLEQSLRALGVDQVDLWLLHEATAEDLDNSNLLPWLQRMQQEGRIGMYGLGTERGKLAVLWQRHRLYCDVLQFEWSILDVAEDHAAIFPGAFCIHHRAVAGALGPMQAMLQRDPARCRRWSDVVDANLADSEILVRLLLHAALTSNPNGIVLFSSREPAHIRSNVLGMEDSGWDGRAQRFCTLMRQSSGNP